MGTWSPGTGPTEGADVYTGDATAEVASGGGGNDTLSGAEGNDTLNGDDGDDILDGGAGVDTLNGGNGSDTLQSGLGADTLNGGEGNDFIVSRILSGGTGQLTIAGGNGIDTLVLASQVSGATPAIQSVATITGIERLTWQGTSGTGSFSYTGTIAQYQAFFGSSFEIVGTDERNFVQFLISAPGVFTYNLASILPFTFTNMLDPELQRLSSVRDRVLFSPTTSPNQTFTVTGTAGSDDISMSSGNDTINGGDGNDVISGGAGVDHYIGGNGNDYFVVFSAAFADYSGETWSGGDGIDFIASNQNLELRFGLAATVTGIEGLAFVPVVAASARISLDWSLMGQLGGVAARIEGAGAGQRNTLLIDMAEGDAVDLSAMVFSNWQSGEDVVQIEGTDGADTVLGGAGDDSFRGHDGNDTFTGGAGNDTFSGGLGNDTFVLDGLASDYTFTSVFGGVRITDTRVGAPSGTDLVVASEFIQFADQTLAVSGLAPPSPTWGVLLDAATLGVDPDNTSLDMAGFDVGPGDRYSYTVFVRGFGTTLSQANVTYGVYVVNGEPTYFPLSGAFLGPVESARSQTIALDDGRFLFAWVDHDLVTPEAPYILRMAVVDPTGVNSIPAFTIQSTTHDATFGIDQLSTGEIAIAYEDSNQLYGRVIDLADVPASAPVGLGFEFLHGGANLELRALADGDFFLAYVGADTFRRGHVFDSTTLTSTQSYPLVAANSGFDSGWSGPLPDGRIVHIEEEFTPSVPATIPANGTVQIRAHITNPVTLAETVVVLQSLQVTEGQAFFGEYDVTVLQDGRFVVLWNYEDVNPGSTIFYRVVDPASPNTGVAQRLPGTIPGNFYDFQSGGAEVLSDGRLRVVYNDGESAGDGSSHLVYSDIDLRIARVDVIGTADDEIFIGTPFDDFLEGAGGDDYLDGGDGPDVAFYTSAASAVTVDLAITTEQDTGGGGRDTLVNIENVSGTAFNDTLFGNGENNILEGGPGDDVLDGRGGNDIAFYGEAAGSVTVNLALTTAQNTGSAGIDRLVSIEGVAGSDHNDTLTGNGLANVLLGGEGDDVLTGAGGNDTILDVAGNAGVATINAGAGDDIISLSGPFGSGVVNGSTGLDQVTVSGVISGLTFQSVETLNTGGGVVTATAAQLRLFQTIQHSASDTTSPIILFLSTGGVLNLTNKAIGRDVHMTGSATIDTLTGSTGNDDIDGGAGGDTLNGGAGNDVLTGGDGLDTLDGGEGDDTLSGGTGNDTLLGGAGDDTISDTGGGIAAISAGLGNDVITLGTTLTSGTVNGGAGLDEVNVSGFLRAVVYTGVETLNTGGGLVTATAAQLEAFDTIRVSSANTNGAVSLRLSAAGTINLAGELGTRAVTFAGSAGNDDITTGDGADTITGGTGDDIIRGRGGNDLILQTSTDGRDSIDGGTGLDTYRLTGVAAAETFRIYTRAEALAAGMTGLAAGTEIVITRDGTTNAEIIAELDNIDEIEINALVSTANNGNGVVDGGEAGGDTIIVIGDFTTTSLDYSTIRIEGSSAADTVDITGLTSAHRVVFTSNGGADSVIGSPRPQDVFNGVVPAFGASDGLDALARSSIRDLRHTDFDLARGYTLRTDLGALAQDSDALNDLLFGADLDALFSGLGRTMVETGDDLTPLDFATHASETLHAAPVFAAIDVSAFNQRYITSDYDILPA